jgi:hypothetical protein
MFSMREILVFAVGMLRRQCSRCWGPFTFSRIALRCMTRTIALSNRAGSSCRKSSIGKSQGRIQNTGTSTAPPSANSG